MQRNLSKRLFGFLRGAATLAAVTLALPGADAASSATGKPLVVSMWGGTYQEAVAAAAVPAFEKETGVKVIFDTGPGPDRLSKLLAQKGAQTTDVFLNSPEFIFTANSRGVLVGLDSGAMKNYGAVADWAKLSDYGVSFGVYAMGIAYNPKLVAVPPTSWRDLWKPEYQGHLALPAINHGRMTSFLVVAAELNGGSIDNIDPGLEALARLKPAVTTHTWTDWAPLAQSKEVFMATEFDLYATAMSRSGDYDIAFAYPKEGAIASPAMAAVVDSGDDARKALARKFIDTLLDPDVQAKIADKIYQSPSNLKAVIPADVAAKVLSAADMQKKARFFDDASLAKLRPKWTQLMNVKVLPAWR